MFRRFVFLGPPGSGKGTQAKYISNKYGIPHISTGSILRDAVSSKTKLGMMVKPYMDDGKLVPDEFMIEIIKERLNESDVKSGFILDGFPRTINQAEEMEKIGINIDRVIYISVSNDEIFRRLLSRYECSDCGYIANLDEIENNTCPKCGANLSKRSDDNTETIGRRIKEYYRMTQPLIDYYRSKKLLLEIDGLGSPEKIFERIDKAILDEYKY